MGKQPDQKQFEPALSRTDVRHPPKSAAGAVEASLDSCVHYYNGHKSPSSLQWLVVARCPFQGSDGLLQGMHILHTFKNSTVNEQIYES